MKQTEDTPIPFIGLHAHSVAGSPFDGLGYPQEHMDFAYENGSDALALTDHGNMNGLAYQVLHAKQMEKDGKNFKPIYGCEVYFLSSIEDWKKQYEEARQDKKRINKLKAGKETTATIIEDEQRNLKDTINRRNHLILLAQNQKGLNNLFQLISKSFSRDNFYRFPRIDYQMLKEHSEGLIAASACLGGVYAGDMWRNKDAGSASILKAMRQTTEQMLDIFGDRWYGELQWNNIPEQHELNKYIIQICSEYGIKLISTADSHYPNPEAWKDRILYRHLGWLGKSSEINTSLPESVEEVGYELYPKNGNQMWESYKKYSDSCGVKYDDELILNSIKETYHIGHDKIEKFYPDSTVRLPSFVIPKGKTGNKALVEFCIEGLKKLKLDKKQEYVDRLHSELTIIRDRGFSKYFLTMKAIADKATEIQIVGPGRGSAAGSLVAYVLGITQIDPIKYGLLFSRFLRSDAKDYPDIDYDVSDPMILKDKLIQEWGDNTVVPISNWNTLQLKSLIKDISKFYKIPFAEVNVVTGKMIKEATGPAKRDHGITAGVYSPTFEEVMNYSESLQNFLKKYPHVKTHVEALYGQVRSASRHAGGCLVGENLDKHMPLINSGGVRQTPWSEGQHVRHLEPMGFIKFDILGLSTLRMIEGCIENILKRHFGATEISFKDIRDFYNKYLHPDKIDLNDSTVYQSVFHEGRWAGIFQFTESGAQNFCMNAKPNSIIDISAITSIFRPGPLSAQVDKTYINTLRSPESVKYLNDTVQEITKETYGFLIFQEQIALLAHKLGKDISLDEGNLLRKVLTKKGTGKGQKVKEKIYKKFCEGCVEKGMSQHEADELWNKFEFFSGYGFNKSHAVSYSILSYQCAWLLTYYPSEWIAAFLDKEPERRKEKAINIAKQLGFGIQPLNINMSTYNWEVSKSGKELIQPFSSIKGLGDAAVKQIMDNRPFETIEDFLFNENIVYSKLNKKALDVLIRSEALNPLIDNRFTGLKHFWSAVAVDRPKNKKRFYKNIEQYAPEGDFTDEEMIEYKVSLTGVFPTHLVMTEHVRGQLEELEIPPLGEYDKEVGVAWFIPREIIQKKTKNNKDYWIVKVIDSTSTTTAIKCWGIRKQDILHINRPYMAKLDYDEQWGFSIRNIRRSFKLLA